MEKVSSTKKCLRGQILAIFKSFLPIWIILRTENVFSSVQSLSCVWLFAIPWTATHQASLSITSSQSLLKPCLSSRWCHPTISSSVIPFSCLKSFPASGSFQMSQLFASGGQSIKSFSFNSARSPNTKSFRHQTGKVKISRLHLIG